MNKYFCFLALALMATAIVSCDEDTMTIGSSLVNENDKLSHKDTTFLTTSATFVADSVLALNSECYLGRVKDPETGTNVTSEFTTQFHVLERTVLPSRSQLDTDSYGHPKSDGCEIILVLSSPFMQDDNLAAMKLRAHELDKPIRATRRFYSNYDPTAHNMLRTAPGSIHQATMFSYQNMTQTDDVRNATTYVENIRIALNDPYTAKDGTLYANYGSYILDKYCKDSTLFRNSYIFADSICPGFFFEIVEGLGFHAKVTDIGLSVKYTYHETADSTVSTSYVFAGTKEVLQTTLINNDKTALESLASKTTHTYVKSPAGLFTELTIPVNEMKQSHENDSLVGARITLQRLNNESTNSRMLGIPGSLLMVEKDSLTAFFEKNKVPDNNSSYFTSYSTSYNVYTFANVSNLVTYLWEKKLNGMKAANIGSDAWEAAHPNWNKVLLVPISYSTSSSSTTITNVVHDMSLSSIKLVGGTQSRDIEINAVYAKFQK